MSESRDTTDFGYEKVSVSEKPQRVRGVFDSVADRYDLMNDLMSAGVHRLWKRNYVAGCRVRSDDQVLDLAGGTGDIARLVGRKLGETGSVTVADINARMLEVGRGRMQDQGFLRSVNYVQCDAECLPFPDQAFDLVTMAFGLRNVTHKDRALESIYRVLRPGGALQVLEFSELTVAPLRPLYDFYSMKILPGIGSLIARDADSYRYLAESIRVHPDQDALRDMFQAVGFKRCGYRNLSGGVVAIHSGYKA